MVNIKALDEKINVLDFLGAMQGRFRQLLASAMTPEEKLGKIIEKLQVDVQEKRVLARELGVQKRALKDPDTKELEPLEAAEAKRAKLVELAARNIDNKQALGAIQQETRSLDAMLSGQRATYATLEESYELARADYQEAYAALEYVEQNGPAILNAIRAHKQAIETRDRVKARRGKKVDTSFMAELQRELGQAQAELRSTDEIDRDLDASDTGFNINKKLAEMDAEGLDEDFMAEVRAAAEAKKKQG